eukprot:6456885-Amphidinium_carterae.1
MIHSKLYQATLMSSTIERSQPQLRNSSVKSCARPDYVGQLPRLRAMLTTLTDSHLMEQPMTFNSSVT